MRQSRKPSCSLTKAESTQLSTGEGNLTMSGLKKELRIKEGGNGALALQYYPLQYICTSQCLCLSAVFNNMQRGYTETRDGTCYFQILH